MKLADLATATVAFGLKYQCVYDTNQSGNLRLTFVNLLADEAGAAESVLLTTIFALANIEAANRITLTGKLSTDPVTVDGIAKTAGQSLVYNRNLLTYTLPSDDSVSQRMTFQGAVDLVANWPGIGLSGLSTVPTITAP